MKAVVLNEEEQHLLKRQDPATESDGGFQRLMVTLKSSLDDKTGLIEIPDPVLERIPRYAFDYGNGGWEHRLKAIFARTLGERLGR